MPIISHRRRTKVRPLLRLLYFTIASPRDAKLVLKADLLTRLPRFDHGSGNLDYLFAQQRPPFLRALKACAGAAYTLVAVA